MITSGQPHRVMNPLTFSIQLFKFDILKILIRSGIQGDIFTMGKKSFTLERVRQNDTPKYSITRILEKRQAEKELLRRRRLCIANHSRHFENLLKNDICLYYL